MTVQAYEKAQHLIAEITAIDSIKMCLDNNHKDACERYLYNFIYKYKNVGFLDLINTIREGLQRQLDEL